MKVGFISLGCSKNLVDTEHMMGALIESGHEIVNRIDLAEAVVVNTCGFITAAKKEAISTILELGQLKEQGRLGILVAAGCLAQRYAPDLMGEMPELDGVIGVSDYLNLPRLLERCAAGERVQMVGDWQPGYSHGVRRLLSTPPGWAYLKIAEGCNNRCSYCAIPGIRGPLRSRPLTELLMEAETLAAEGIKELILVAQDSTAYGLDLKGQGDLLELVRKLAQIEGVYWIRIMYAYPPRDASLLEAVLQIHKVVPYLDMPIQHGSDRILAAMGRRYNRDDVYRLVGNLREKVSNLVLRTTLLTGFPGETLEDHEQNMTMLRELEFDWTGVFAYSKEDGTVAGQLSSQVDEPTKDQRRRELLHLQQKITRKKNRNRIGSPVTVLIDKELNPGTYRGRSFLQAPEVDGNFIVKSDRPLVVGEFVNAVITRVSGYDLVGELYVGDT